MDHYGVFGCMKRLDALTDDIAIGSWTAVSCSEIVNGAIFRRYLFLEYACE